MECPPCIAGGGTALCVTYGSARVRSDQGWFPIDGGGRRPFIRACESLRGGTHSGPFVQRSRRTAVVAVNRSLMPKLGIIGSSSKKNEKRLPIHPDHLARLPEELRRQLIFEEGYGASLGIGDEEIARYSGGTATRRELLTDLGAVLVLKPGVGDLEVLREGGLL